MVHKYELKTAYSYCFLKIQVLFEVEIVLYGQLKNEISLKQ